MHTQAPTLHRLLRALAAVEVLREEPNGMDVCEYRSRHPEEGAVFHAGMTGFSRRVDAAVSAPHDVSPATETTR